jgi:uncharacterized phage-associated protein
VALGVWRRNRMDDLPPYDARIIANEVVDLAREFKVELTHLSLQKIVYFLHEAYLRESGVALCSGYFEAWKHGPVHPQIWSSFKAAGRAPIRHHAYGLSIDTGLPKNLPRVSNSEVRLYLASEGSRLLRIPAPRLVGLSHAREGPWDVATRDSRGQREYGARISNNLILQCRTGRLLSVRDSDANEDDLYEQPPS